MREEAKRAIADAQQVIKAMAEETKVYSHANNPVEEEKNRRIRDLFENLTGEDLLDLHVKARVLDDIIAIVKLANVSPDMSPAELFRKIRGLLEGRKLI